ncbi:MAG: TetR/AcrR family transcriptional regulator [Candidatus Kapabacteria bacterium]|nr:TetR/AcrR family transcriptional regulator [Candidatus Kapabacteria bacterium]
MGIRERREKEREQRRADILRAARIAFSEIGIEQASVERIAQESELGKGTIYLYFKSKEEILLALMVEDMVRLDDMIDAVIERGTKASDKLLGAFDVFYEFADENPLFFHMITHVDIKSICEKALVERLPGSIQELFIKRNQQTYQRLVDVVAKGAETGEFYLRNSSEDTVLMLEMALKGAMIVITHNMVAPGMPAIDAKSILRSTAEHLVLGLRSREAPIQP